MELRILRGNPTPEELAALIVVLTKRREAPESAPPSRWATTARPGFFHPDGRPTRPTPSAWITSALPH